MVIDITHYKKDVSVIAKTNAGKSLTYQSILEGIGDIVLIISSTIAFMENQTEWLYQQSILTISLISTTIANNPDIWRQVNKRDYLIGFSSLEMLLDDHSPFYQRTVRNQTNKFC